MCWFVSASCKSNGMSNTCPSVCSQVVTQCDTNRRRKMFDVFHSFGALLSWNFILKLLRSVVKWDWNAWPIVRISKIGGDAGARIAKDRSVVPNTCHQEMSDTFPRNTAQCSSRPSGDGAATAASPECSGYEGDDESSGSCLEFTVSDASTAKNRFQKRGGGNVWQVHARSWPSVSSQVRKSVSGEGMVLEPKFTDYGSIHSAELPQLQQHNSSHALLSPRSVLSLPPLDEEEPKTSKGKNMLQGDLYQRQPLLPNAGKNDKRNKEYFVDEDEENILHSSENTNGHIRIEMPLPQPIREEPRFPQEKCKTLIASVVTVCSFLLTLLSLSIIHDKVPDRKIYAPLPDVILNVVPAQDWALDVSEYIIMVSVNTMLLAMLLHKHRFIVFRRIFLVLSLLYMYRAITMFVTVLPVSSKTYYCSPKSNDTTPLEVAKRIVQLFSGFGLSVNGKHTYCGDFIYSGHTVVLVFSYLFISEYTPKKLYLVHWLYWLFAVVGVCMVQISHGHYTVDVVIAYFITTRTFWIYHTLANNSTLKQHSPNNHLGRLWWFTFFLYFEGNVSGPVPRQWPDWPLPWPRRFLAKSRES